MAEVSGKTGRLFIRTGQERKDRLPKQGAKFKH